MFQDFSPRNPFRPVHWRWERSGLIVDGRLPFSRKRDDAWTLKAARFRKKLAKCKDAYDEGCLSEEAPDVYWAYRLWDVQKSDGDDVAGDYRCGVRYEVEARILAGETDERIAERSGLEPGDVAAYEKVFFNVRDKLDRSTYIFHQVLGPAVQRGIYSREWDLLWKLYGYMRGPAMLDFMISAFQSWRTRTPDADVLRQLEADQSGMLLRQAAITTQTLRINSETQCDVVGLWFKLKELERLKGATGSGGDAVLVGLAKFLEINNYSVGAPDPAREGRSILAEYDEGAIEVGGRALVDMVASGAVEPNPLLQDRPFPVPTRPQLEAPPS